MIPIFRKLPGRKRARLFYAWQVELTTRCSLRCAMCPRSGSGDWREGDMAMDDFRRLIPGFNDTENVVLEGWGEPLLHRDLIECIRLVKQNGAAAGFVTSGQTLDEAYMESLLDVGVDFMGFSFAGSTAETHDRIRAGSDFHALVENIRLLCGKKAERGSRVPRIHLVYLMMKDNMEELPFFMGIADRLGVKAVVLLNQILVTTPRQREQRVFDSPEAGYYESILRETAIRGGDLGIRLHRPSLFPGEVTLCDENPLRNLYISVTGEVSPCVYLNPPTGSPDFPCEGREAPFGQVSFGNIFRQAWPDIWNGEPYVRFRGHFEKRLWTLDEIHARLGGMGMDFPSRAAILPEPPGPCKGCSKIMGA